MTLILPPEVEQILATLKENGFDAYVVGGAVRSALMDMSPDDFDITTSAKPDRIKALFSHTADIGLKHGTVGVIIGGQIFEVTTFRTEGVYSDNRRPDQVSFVEDLLADLSRRDFTINAMAYSPSKGLIDPFEGALDIQKRMIRTVGDPALRFGEDALRMLRGIRFCAKLGFELDAQTYNGILTCRDLIRHVSAERIHAELEKMLLSDHPGTIKLLKDTGLMDYFLAPLSRCFDTQQKNIHHFTDVGAHSLLAVENVPKEPVLRWAALLHDIGKPDTQTLGADNQHHFYGHGLRSVELAQELLHALKFSGAQKHAVLTLIKYHDRPIEPTSKAVKRAIQRVGQALFLPLLDLKRGDALAQHPDYRAEKLAKIDELERVYQQIQADNEAVTLKDLAIDGKDLINLGFAPGAILGQVLETLLLAVLDRPALNQKEILLALAQELKKLKL